VRSYIEAGEARPGGPMGPAERAIIDTFEAVTKRPELMLEFTLQPGRLFINNYTILHARTAFDDGRRAGGFAPSLIAAVARRAIRPCIPTSVARHPADSSRTPLSMERHHCRSTGSRMCFSSHMRQYEVESSSAGPFARSRYTRPRISF